jgi:hypothetical protein
MRYGLEVWAEGITSDGVYIERFALTSSIGSERRYAQRNPGNESAVMIPDAGASSALYVLGTLVFQKGGFGCE